MEDEFIKVWKSVKSRSKQSNDRLRSAMRSSMPKNSMRQNSDQDTKYKYVKYAVGTFYYKGRMYRIEDGKEVDVYSDVDMEMIRIAEIIDG